MIDFTIAAPWLGFFCDQRGPQYAGGFVSADRERFASFSRSRAGVERRSVRLTWRPLPRAPRFPHAVTSSERAAVAYRVVSHTVMPRGEGTTDLQDVRRRALTGGSVKHQAQSAHIGVAGASPPERIRIIRLHRNAFAVPLSARASEHQDVRFTTWILLGKPFQLNPDPAPFGSRTPQWPTWNMAFTRTKGFIVITGEIGAGQDNPGAQPPPEKLDPSKVVAAQLVSTQIDADSIRDWLPLFWDSIAQPREGRSSARARGLLGDHCRGQAGLAGSSTRHRT